MKKSTSIKDFAGIDSLYTKADGTKMAHDELYGTVVNAIGLDRCLDYVPVEPEKLSALYEEDEHFNNVPLKKWDDQHAMFKYQFGKVGINIISLSDTVCTLKTAARMYVKGDK